MSIKNRLERIERRTGRTTDLKEKEKYVAFMNDLRDAGEPPLTLADYPEDDEILSHEEWLTILLNSESPPS